MALTASCAARAAPLLWAGASLLFLLHDGAAIAGEGAAERACAALAERPDDARSWLDVAGQLAAGARLPCRGQLQQKLLGREYPNEPYSPATPQLISGAGLSRPVSRRGFLAGTGGLIAAATLAACAPGAGGTSGGAASTFGLLLPGDVPAQWDRIRAAVNAKLEADLGFELKPEFINWTNYKAQSLLKFTARENFQTALSARWLNIAQLIESGALQPLDDALASGKYTNLAATVDQSAFEANRWPDGSVYGVPAVNSAARIHHLIARGDLADKHAPGGIETFDQLEKFWYDAHQKEGIPGYVNRNSVFDVLGAPTGALYAQGWETPDLLPLYFSSDSLLFVPAGGTGRRMWSMQRLCATRYSHARRCTARSSARSAP